jgi:hypothetical protein
MEGHVETAITLPGQRSKISGGAFDTNQWVFSHKKLGLLTQELGR